MAALPPAPTLPCKECGFVNEPERVYCHNCGAKLDRSVLPKEDQLRREPPEKARKRIMRMTNPGQNVFKSILATLVKTLVYAALMAAIIQIFRTPVDAPSGKEPGSRLVGSELGGLAGSPVPKQLVFHQGELNSFLSTKVKMESVVPGITYVRTYLLLGPGIVRAAIERRIWIIPFHVATIYRVEAGPGPFVAVNTGGYLGRLPIHPQIMEYASPYLFGHLATALKGELDSLRKLSWVHLDSENHDPKVVLATKGGGRG